MRRGALFLALLLAGGCLPELPQGKNPHIVQPPPPPKGLHSVDHTFALMMISGRRVKKVKAWVFDTGKMSLRGEAVSSLKSYHADVSLSVPAFLVEHPKEGYILFDTGLSPIEARRPKTQGMRELLDAYAPRYEVQPRRDLASQLKIAGVEASDIRWVVLSHLHPEQAGMIDAFPKATIVASRLEWESAKRMQSEGALSWLPRLESLEKALKVKLLDIHNAPALGPFDNAIDLFGDGIFFAVSLPGHTAGNIGAWVNLDGGPVLFAGGAALVVDNYFDKALPAKPLMHDVDDFWRSVHVIRAAAEAAPALIVFPAHDLITLKLSQRSDVTLITPGKFQPIKSPPEEEAAE